MSKEDGDNVVIFGGNLDELHKRYPDRKYEIAEDFYKTQVPQFYDNVEDNTRIELSEEGYGGIIRARLLKMGLISLIGAWGMQGVPVKRIK